MIKHFFYLSVIAAFLLCSCDSNEPDGSDKSDEQLSVNSPNQAIEKDFISRFPGVTEVEWSQKDGYEIGTFKTAYTRSSTTNAREVEAWYLLTGSCEMVEADFSGELPLNIKNAWETSDYYKNGFTILVDAELITRDNKIHIYKLEVADVEYPDEEGYDLFYSTDAKLLSYLPDTNTPNNTKNNNLPTPITYKKYIEDNYSDGFVLTVYYDEDSSLGKVCDIDVFSKNKAYYITFNDETKTFHREHSFWTLDEVPQIIKDAVLNIENGANNENTEIERVVEKSKDIYYMIQVDMRYIKLNEKGELVNN